MSRDSWSFHARSGQCRVGVESVSSRCRDAGKAGAKNKVTSRPVRTAREPEAGRREWIFPSSDQTTCPLGSGHGLTPPARTTNRSAVRGRGGASGAARGTTATWARSGAMVKKVVHAGNGLRSGHGHAPGSKRAGLERPRIEQVIACRPDLSRQARAGSGQTKRPASGQARPVQTAAAIPRQGSAGGRSPTAQTTRSDPSHQ